MTIFIIGYAIICLGLYIFQRDLIYYPDPRRADLSNTLLHNDFQEVQFQTQDGLNLYGWYHEAQEGFPTILLMHGNGGHLGYRDIKAYRWIQDTGAGFFLFSYRGYGGNPGHPTEQGLYQDAAAAFDFLRSQGIESTDILLYGESLGTGVATHLAQGLSDPVYGIILESPFLSIADIGARRYRLFPVNLLLKDRFDSAEKVSGIRSPVLIILAGRDKIVPVEESLRLKEFIPTPTDVITYEHSGHNNLHDFIDPREVLDRLRLLKNNN